MNEQTNEQMNKWTNKWVNKRKIKQIEQTNK
jgi:hypothetical protein